MAALLSWLWDGALSLLMKLGFYNKTATLTVVGLDNAGKSTLLSLLSTGTLRQYAPTQQERLEEFQVGGVTFAAWDLGGHAPVRRMWRSYFARTDAVVFLVDAADPDRFPEAKKELHQLLDMPELTETPIAILFSKCDLSTAKPTSTMIRELDLESTLSTTRPIRCFSVSSLSRSGHTEAFSWVANQIP